MNIRVKSSRLLVGLSLLAVSTIVALLLSEMAFRVMGFEPMYVSPERDRFWRYDALLGWAHEPGQEGIFETPQFRTHLQINQKGLRDQEHTYERKSDVPRILVLGDSFAWGYGVEESERFSELLEKSLGVEVINAGVSGYSTDQELLWLDSEGIKYDVDLIVLVFAGNDIGDNQRQLVNTIYYKPRFMIESGQLALTGSPVPSANGRDKSIYKLSQRSAIAFFVVQRYFELQSFYMKRKANPRQIETTEVQEQDSTDAFDLTVALLDAIRNDAQSKKASFMIVATDHWWNAPSGGSYEAFIKLLERRGFLVLDVKAAPGFDSQQMQIPDDGHWSVEGHQFVTQKVAELIERHQLLGQSQK